MPTDAPYAISDLAGLTGLTVRTIRYYLAQGLIPPSGESGPGAHYGERHLGRLRLVRRLQQQHLPLAEIRDRLASLSDADVIALLAEPETPAATPETSALDYVRSVLAGAGTIPAPVLPPLPAAMPATGATPPAPAGLLRRSATPFLAEAPPPVAADPQPPSIERSQWERLSLGANLELHVRRPLGRLEQKRVERLITIARQVLKEEQP